MQINLLVSQAQRPYRPFEKINFQGLKTNWYETFYDTTAISDLLDGYSHFRSMDKLPPLVYLGRIYSALLINTDKGIVGGYIDCRDLNTGKVIWRDRFGKLDGEHIEIPNFIMIENDKLVVYGLIRRTNEFGSNLIPTLDQMILSKRIYNIADGALELRSHGDFDDASLLNMHYDIFYSAEVFFYREKNKIRYIQPSLTKDLGKVIVHSYLLDEQGRVLNHDSLHTDQILFNITQISEDTLLIVEIDSSALLFRYVSPNLETYFVKETDYPFDHYPAFIQLKELSYDRRKLLFYNKRNEFYPDSYYEIYVFNLDGTLDQKYDLKGKFIEDFSPIRWYDNNGLLLVRNFQRITSKRSKSMLDVRQYKNEQDLINVKTFVATDSLRDVYIGNVIPLKDNNLLTIFSERAFYIDSFQYITPDYNAIATSYLSINEKDLGIASNLTELKENLLVTIHPNPFENILRISDIQNGLNEIEIFDNKGRIIYFSKISKYLSEIEINLSDQVSGIYFVKLSDNEKAVTYRVVKI